MRVVDASVTVAALLNDGQARRVLAQQQLHVPRLIDSEIASSLRRRVSAGQLLAASAWNFLRIWQRLGVRRYPMVSLLARVWALRDDVSSYDAAYVALAEFLDCGGRHGRRAPRTGSGREMCDYCRAELTRGVVSIGCCRN